MTRDKGDRAHRAAVPPQWHRARESIPWMDWNHGYNRISLLDLEPGHGRRCFIELDRGHRVVVARSRPNSPRGAGSRTHRRRYRGQIGRMVCIPARRQCHRASTEWRPSGQATALAVAAGFRHPKWSEHSRLYAGPISGSVTGTNGMHVLPDGRPAKHRASDVRVLCSSGTCRGAERTHSLEPGNHEESR